MADSVQTDFEGFTPGSVNGQGGWKSAPANTIPSCPQTGGQYDQAVVGSGDVPGFGEQSLRMSNRCATGAFADQTYSAPVAHPAGETQANNRYTAQFSFISTSTSEQPGLFLTVSPDNGEGMRMSWVGLTDAADGIEVSVNDTPEPDGEFVDHDVALLSRDAPHTIGFSIKLNPGPDNDVVRIAIDGRDVGECFTTWENFYDSSAEQAPATIDRLQFRSSVGGFEQANGGFLFDNVSTTTAEGAGPAGCDDVIEKKADAPTVTAGGLAGYSIAVRNRGRGSDRNVQLCDRIPRGTRFVSANRKLHRVGRRRCLVIPHLAPGQRVGFHVELRVDASAPPGTLANVADITPGVRLPGSETASTLELPNLRAAPGGRAHGRTARGAHVAVRRARALVRILRRVRPSFTG